MAVVLPASTVLPSILVLLLLREMMAASSSGGSSPSNQAVANDNALERDIYIFPASKLDCGVVIVVGPSGGE